MTTKSDMKTNHRSVVAAEAALGLFIVGEIARAHGGTVAVSSTAEEGTTFTVRLPRASATVTVAQHA